MNNVGHMIKVESNPYREAMSKKQISENTLADLVAPAIIFTVVFFSLIQTCSGSNG